MLFKFLNRNAGCPALCCIIVGMNIQENTQKFKAFLHNTEYQLAALIIAISVASFFLGRTSVSENSQELEGEIQTVSLVSSVVEKDITSTDKIQVSTPGGYVASRSGTKYHLPWCSSAQRIKEENKIWFETKEAAEKAGYTPAGNCPGL
jgi:hypothetical protein